MKLFIYYVIADRVLWWSYYFSWNAISMSAPSSQMTAELGSAVAEPEHDPESDNDNASQTTEDDPHVPQAPQAPIEPIPKPPSHSAQQATASGSASAQVNAHSDKPRPYYEHRFTLTGHTMGVSSVKFSPDGKMLASCCVIFLLFIFQKLTISPCSCRQDN